MKNMDELSVEEILGSIRDVINNHSKPSKKNNTDEDILELTEVNYAYEGEGRLISDTISDSATQTMKDFVARASKIDHKIKKKDLKNCTLEDLVINIVRSEISLWLENNLESIVRATVEKEIRKLTPRDD